VRDGDAVIVSTARLDLHPLPLPLIDALLAGDLATAEALAPFRVRAASFEGDDYVLGLRQAQLRADPTELPWLYRAAVLREHGEVVARGGFHAPPDHEGIVEIGYRVLPPWRGRRLAVELASGLIGWAQSQGAARCLASTAPGNAASQAVLTRLGFVRTGEAMDEVDGLEWVFTLELR
jgi:ribosomal-protein-alanine N-acetyltransferase